MINQDFVPMSGQLGIASTSYQVQLGLINGKWTSRLLKGKEVIDSHIYKDASFPSQDEVTGWILRTLPIPNINSHQVKKTVQALIKQAKQNMEQKIPVVPISEVQGIQLKKVPESELKRPRTHGWVNEKQPLKFCSTCSEDSEWKFCPYCGKLLS